MPFAKASPVITGEGDRLRWWGHKNPLSKVGYVLCADRLRTLHVDLRHTKIACGIDDGLVLEGREPTVERRELRRAIERGILPHETELYALTERLPETPHEGDALAAVSRQDEMPDAATWSTMARSAANAAVA